MRRISASTKFAVISALALVAAACSGSSEEVDVSQLELSETMELQGFGYSIDYPSGWLASSRFPVTIISELEEDHSRALEEDDFDPIGYHITFDHRNMAFMQGLGLPEDPTLDDLLEMNKRFFEWKDPIGVSETEIFGVPAYRIETQDGSVQGITLMGFRGGEAFLLSLGTSSEDAMNAFRPTWEQMLESLRPTE